MQPAVISLLCPAAVIVMAYYDYRYRSSVITTLQDDVCLIIVQDAVCNVIGPCDVILKQGSIQFMTAIEALPTSLGIDSTHRI